MNEVHLTQQRRAILAAVNMLTWSNSRPPTYREIGAVAGLTSVRAVRRQVSLLCQAGLLRRSDDEPRTVSLGPRAAGSRSGAVAFVAAAFQHHASCYSSLPPGDRCLAQPHQRGRVR